MGAAVDVASVALSIAFLSRISSMLSWVVMSFLPKLLSLVVMWSNLVSSVAVDD